MSPLPLFYNIPNTSSNQCANPQILSLFLLLPSFLVIILLLLQCPGLILWFVASPHQTSQSGLWVKLSCDKLVVIVGNRGTRMVPVITSKASSMQASALWGVRPVTAWSRTSCERKLQECLSSEPGSLLSSGIGSPIELLKFPPNLHILVLYQRLRGNLFALSSFSMYFLPQTALSYPMQCSCIGFQAPAQQLKEPTPHPLQSVCACPGLGPCKGLQCKRLWGSSSQFWGQLVCAITVCQSYPENGFFFSLTSVSWWCLEEWLARISFPWSFLTYNI